MEYKGLPTLLHIVRWSQHLLAIIAEILILLSFAMSGMDANLGGIMTAIPFLKWIWAAMFALGIDAMFVISWVRLRQAIVAKKKASLFWNGLLAIAMSYIVFQPVAIQLLQQALAMSFNQALAMLGINIVILTYARAIVAVFLGAVLALSNIEQKAELSSHQTIKEPVATSPKKEPVATSPKKEPVATSPKKEPVATSPKKERIEQAIREAIASGKKPRLTAIARDTNTSYSYVKGIAREMEEADPHTDGIPALQVVK